jgi:predicted RNA-binding protein
MAFWLCILNRENFEAVRKEQVWGVAERHKKQLSRAKPGELCAFYLIAEGAGDNRKEPIIGGIAEIASEPYEDLSDIFPSKRNPSEVYPYSGHLLGKAMREIPEEDMKLISGMQS